MISLSGVDNNGYECIILSLLELGHVITIITITTF